MRQKLILWALFLVQSLVRDKLPPLLKRLDEKCERLLMKTMFPKTTKILSDEGKQDVQ